MLTLMLVLLAAPKAPPAATAAAESIESRRPSTGQCEVVDVKPMPAAPRRTREVASDHLGDTDEGGAEHRRRQGPSFSAARTIDLQLGAELRGRARPDARLELRLYTPRGHLYQVLRATAPGRTRRAASHGSSPAPWTAGLPVAGTAIVNHSLYGRWRVEPHLDGSPRPCGPAERFWILP